jgi:hypothetical protein
LLRHAGADDALDDRREAVDHQTRQDAAEDAERGEAQHRGEREPVGLDRALGRHGARPAEEGDAERLDEAGGR